MLRRALIHQHKSCYDVELDGLQEVTALIGRNGVGKSNILRAISWAAKMATGEFQPKDRPSYRSFANSAVTLEFVCLELIVRYQVEVSYVRGSPGKLRIVESLSRVDEYDGELVEWQLVRKDDNGIHVFDGPSSQIFLADPGSAMLPAVVATLRDSENATVFASALAYLQGIRYYPLNELNYEESFSSHLIDARGLSEWTNERNALRSPMSEALYRILSMYLFDQDKFDELKILLGQHGLGLIEDIEISAINLPKKDGVEAFELRGQALSHYYSMYFMQMAGTVSFSMAFDDLSHGTRRAIDLIAALLFDQSTLMLIEHPEDAIHIGLLRKIIGVLVSYSADVQAILATHSRTVLNELQLSQLRFVSLDEGMTSVHRLRGDKLIKAEQYIVSEGSEGGSVADFVDSFSDLVE